MTKLPLLVLAVAVTGCIGPFNRPTLRPGSNVAVSKPASVSELVAKALLCTSGASADTSRLKSQACSANASDSALKLPVRKP